MMKARFDVTYGEDGDPGRSLVYRHEEYSFDTLISRGEGFTSVLLDDLNIELDESGQVVAIWGLCPHTRWEACALVSPEAQKGSLSFVCDRPLTRGVSVRLNQAKYLPVLFDEATGWVQVKGEGTPSLAVAIFPGVIFELTGQGEVANLWLKPQETTVTS
jgi:hypothetical protein